MRITKLRTTTERRASLMMSTNWATKGGGRTIMSSRKRTRMRSIRRMDTRSRWMRTSRTILITSLGPQRLRLMVFKATYVANNKSDVLGKIWDHNTVKQLIQAVPGDIVGIP